MHPSYSQPIARFTPLPLALDQSPSLKKVKRPTIAAAGTSDEWAYFTSWWNDYVDASKITGKDKVVQLHECCDEPLLKELTKAAGGRGRTGSHQKSCCG